VGISTDRAASLKLAALFVALTAVPLATLGWLGWRLLEQDRALERQRFRERLENAATLLTRELDRSLATWEALLPAAAQGNSVALPPDAVLLVFDVRGVVRHQGARLPFYPLVHPPPDVPGEPFAAAEALEFREQDLGRAATAYRRLASTNDGGVRAAALARLARSLRKQGRLADALAVYGELAAMGETPVMGSPAELLARRERLVLFRKIGDEEAGAREAAALGKALWEAGFRIDRPTFEFYRESAPPAPAAHMLVLAEAAEDLWPLWQQQPAGRATWSGDGPALATVWRRTAAAQPPSSLGSRTWWHPRLTSQVVFRSASRWKIPMGAGRGEPFRPTARRS
jgi:hypothetical protein